MADSDMVELQTPTREWKGWIRNRFNHELEWCIVTAGLMGVFRDPEADHARIVLNLGDFDVKPFCEGAKRGSHVIAYVDDCYSIQFVSKRDARSVYTFGAETEDDFRAWHRGLTGRDVADFGFDATMGTPPSSNVTSGRVKSGHRDAKRMDSGLGDDLPTSPGGNLDGRGGNSRGPFEAIIESEEVGSSLRTSRRKGSATPDSSGGKSESSDSSLDSTQSNDTTPDSELADEVPRLRANARHLRVTRCDESRFSAPVGDFSLWEEVRGEDGTLTKTYSLPMKSPHRLRASSVGNAKENAFEFDDASTGNSSTSDLHTTRPSSTTPTSSRPKPVTSFSDPGRKKLGSRMTVKASRLVGRMANLRSQRSKTPLAQSSIVSVTVDGDLLRKHKSTLIPCFCVLSGSVMYCYKSKDSEDLSDLTIDIHKYRLSKLNSAKSETKELDCAFVLTPHHRGGKEYTFIAKDLDLARKWYGHLEDILKELEARQIRAMQRSAPDLRGSLPSMTMNQTGSYALNHHQSKYMKARSKGSTFKRLAMEEEEKRNSIAARMSRASFEDGYGFTEEMSRHRASIDSLISSRTDHVDDDDDNDEEEDTFIEITMDDVMRSKNSLGDRAVSRSMDDIGMTSSLSRSPLVTGKSPLGLGRTTPKTKRHKRVVPIPASEVTSPLHTGYLEVKKSGSWKRCWTLLTDDRLYLYRKPTDSHTFDMIMLDEYDVQISVPPSSTGSPKTGSRFAFELFHPRVTGTQFLCESREERTDWMSAIGERCTKINMDGTAANRGSREKLAPLMTRLDSESSEKQAHLSVDSKGSSSSSDLSDDSPILERKKQIIEDKYERVKEAQEMEMLRMHTILNQRRMSADVKINAVEKKLLQQRKQRKRKKNSRGDSLDEEGEFLEEQLEQLKTRYDEINKESQETTLKQGERLKAIESKKDVEFKILEQERKLQKHRKAAQQALQQIVKGISSITPPVGGSRPRFDLISEEAEDETDERKLSMTSSVGISSSDSMGSLCDPKKSSVDAEGAVVPVRPAATASAPLTRRHAVHTHPKLSLGDSSSDSSSSADSPDVVRHNFNLVDEFTKTFPALEGTLEQASRDKSKSFDSGIADEVDINSNKSISTTTTTTANGDVNDNDTSAKAPIGKHIRTEISEDVLRDIEAFEIMARRALEQASWVV